MKHTLSFECLRSVNNTLHNKMLQETQYQAYLKRIDNIVERKHLRDTSADFYMTFLRKCKNLSKKHKESESTLKIGSENQKLLNKILQNNNSNSFSTMRSETYHPNLEERRNRQVQKINEENLRMVKRIIDQPSVLRKNINSINFSKISKDQNLEKKSSYANWSYSPLFQRKLPKLVSSPQRIELSQESSRITTKRAE